MIKTTLENGTYTSETGLHGDSIGQLCRKLVANGEPDGPMEVFRGEKKSMDVRSIHLAAKSSPHEEPNPHWGKFTPFVKWESDEEVSA
jgi:hypothetical protein